MNDRAAETDAPAGGSFPGLPKIKLPQGGGAIKGLGEKFTTNPVTGTASLSVPIATSTGRSQFGPELALTYDSGSGNSVFGLGWRLSVPSIARRTDDGVPRYEDIVDSDVFVLSGAEDLVPVVVDQAGDWVRRPPDVRVVNGVTYLVARYRPRVEGAFARIERWTNRDDAADVAWRSIDKQGTTTWYGRTAASRVVDPADPCCIYRWEICESYDDKGNVVVYEYKAEDAIGVDTGQAHERQRTEASRAALRYLKRIKYGHRASYFPRLAPGEPFTPVPQAWSFEVVFDYGEHDASAPTPAEVGAWSVRHDPYSLYNAGFEVRCYRLCQRVLMFHHFPEEPDVGSDCLVRSTDFAYRHEQPVGDPRAPIHTVLTGIEHCGYRRANVGYTKKSLPPIELEYSEAVIGTDVLALDADSLRNLPVGVDGAAHQWVDLDGEGAPGVLTQHEGAWYYKRNRSPLSYRFEAGEERIDAALGALERVGTLPAAALVAEGGTRLVDVEGDGRLDVVKLGAVAGYYRREGTLGPNERWGRFRPFTHLPILDWEDPNLRFVDLTGNGLPDILVTENDVLTWYPSLREEGYGTARRTHLPPDDLHGPCVVFANAAESLFLADLSGDGLTDIVRIRNGEVSYWPSLGHGRFGAKVTMDAAPWYDTEDQFDPRRLRLADVDGSGLTDILYLGPRDTRLWFNQSGNAWSEPVALDGAPPADSATDVSTIDLLGNGTACLVWSTRTPGKSRRALHYLELMRAGKPHLLVRRRNNLGAETRIRYAPSTYFYQRDADDGRPWLTRLPFPVHVVECIETYDHVSRVHFVTRYAYHHGYYDGVEREFRGFGMVEQFDTESFAALSEDGDLPVDDNLDVASHVPPVLTRTWFHTGVHLGREHVSDFYAGINGTAGEYYCEPGLTDEQAAQRLLPDTQLPANLSLEEEREACRALKGSMLRQEVYALDGSDRESHPYSVLEQNLTVQLVQPHAGNSYAVLFTHANETLTYHYERDPGDPRIAHKLTLEVDAFGNVLKEASIAYGRRAPDAAIELADSERQARSTVIYNENAVTNDIDDADAHFTPLPSEASAYELTGYVGTGPDGRLRRDDLLVEDGGAFVLAFDSELEYLDEPTGGHQRRLVEQTRTLYRHDDFGAMAGDPLALLPLGVVESLAIEGESYKLALTPDLLAQIYRRSVGGRPEEDLLPVPSAVLGADIHGGQTADRGGYVDLDGDGRWWLPDGRTFYSPGESDSPAQEIAIARERFFLPHRFRNPFGEVAFVRYDPYRLLMNETQDAVGNLTTVGERDPTGALVVTGNDYRVLQPALTMDPNRNRTAVAYDALGMVLGTAVMGKPEETAGDSLAGFDTDLDEVQLLEHLEHPLVNPHAILGVATNRMVYDLFAYHRTREDERPQPSVVYIITRETHVADLAPGESSPLQHGFTYSDGFERVVQNKVLAEPGEVPLRDADGRVVLGPDGLPELAPEPADPRWVGSGWKVFNNKGKPVREYEEFFTDTHRFEPDFRIGVSPVLFYDPVGRVVATLHADHTFRKTLLGAWREERWDVNDTVLVADPAMDPDVGAYFARLSSVEYLPTWHTRRAGGALGPDEQAAAEKTTLHAGTPTVAYADALGRSFLTVIHNRYRYSDAPGGSAPIEEFLATRVHTDILGQQREVIDAQGRVVSRYDYDMLGTLVHQAGMESGERWLINDAVGQPIRSWDSRGQAFRIPYDSLRRPTETFVRPAAGAAELLVERTRYGEQLAAPEAGNTRGRVVELSDQAGFVIHVAYDFKGNLLESRRRLAVEYTHALDWSAAVPLEPEVYTSRTAYDALNRTIRLEASDGSVVEPTYNEANLLQGIDVDVRGAGASPYVTNVDYDAKGRRTRIDYANGASMTYEYDPETMRLGALTTTRAASDFSADCPSPPDPASPGCGLQRLRYTYDPVGNVTNVRDDAQQTIYFRNRRVEPSRAFNYDALYRLIDAEGREHLGQIGGAPGAPGIPGASGQPHEGLLQPGDGNAMGRYFERYAYDAVGNLLELLHRGSDPVHAGWHRTYEYEEPSLLDGAVHGNRLTSTTVGGTTETYHYDGLEGVHGNITGMGHLPVMRWNHRDQLQATARQVVNGGVPETTWYVYDSSGQRVRKVTQRAAGAGEEPRRLNERIYLGGFEVYRRYGADGMSVSLERETLHVMDDRERVALVETRTLGDDGSPQQMVRYQLGDHLSSAVLELGESGQVLSYEEYSPFGVTTYQAVRAQTDVPKRYRYCAMERDEESGLAYHGERYYALWLGRWMSPDPIGLQDGVNVFVYCANNPVNRVDRTGTNGTPSPLDFSSFEEFAEASDEHAQATVDRGRLAQEWQAAVSAEEASRTSVSDETAAARAAVEAQFQRDLQRLRNIRTPALAFIMPSHVRPYLRDQTAGIQDPYLRFIAGINQRGGLAVAQFTNRLAAVTVITWGVGMAASAVAAPVIAKGIGMSALLAGGARLVTAYRSASLFIASNYARITVASTTAAGVSRSSWVQTGVQNVWRLNPFQRGRVIETALTRVLQGTPMRASNFPTIDMWVRGANNLASRITSIKSINLASSSYQRGSAVYNRLIQYVDTLANFAGRTWGGETVRVGANTVRVLEVAIPPNVATAAQLQQLQRAAVYAQQHGITLNIRIVQ
ncbi:MAG: SpvB/TcaC N-terminal domain-containing protein [Pseudomonadota bacterium]